MIRTMLKAGDIVVYKEPYLCGHGRALLSRDTPIFFAGASSSRVHHKHVVAIVPTVAAAEAMIRALDREYRQHLDEERAELRRHRNAMAAILKSHSAGPAGVHASAA